jgi:peptide/nickel transport system permease protein
VSGAAVELSGPPATTERERARHPLARFVVRRLAQGLVTLLVASAVIFFATSVIPGSPATSILGHSANPQAVRVLDHRLGYDKPITRRYVDWLNDVVHGRLGDSAVVIAQGAPKAPVWPTIRSPLANSVTLALVTTFFLIPISLTFGVLAGVKAGRWPDHLISVASLVFVSLPEFVVATILVTVFFVVFDLLPPVSVLPPGDWALTQPKILVLPVLTLLAVSVAWTVRLVRVGTIEVLKADYVQTARLHGISEPKVMRRYVLRNSLAPSIQIFALSVQYLFGGVIVTETVFGYPGIGKQLVDAVNSHDTTEVQAIALILATIYILINIFADLLVVLLVPKLRTQL